MRLLFMGDVMLGRVVNAVLKREGPAYPWGDTLAVLQAGDVRLCNLECALSDRGTPWSASPKMFHFRSDAKNVAVLQAAGIDFVSLANNHALDYGFEALQETLTLLDAGGVRHAGAGTSLAEAAQPAVAEIQGRKIGMLAFTDNEPVWEATVERPGTQYVPTDIRDPRAQRLFEAVRRTRQEVDLLVVAGHWGPNWGYAPPQEHVSFGHALIDAGADLVFGHSGHVFRGIEIYQQHLILYCAGNFIDDYAVDAVERNDESGIFAVDIDKRAVLRLRMYPTVIEDCQARLARGSRAQHIAAKLQHLSAALGTASSWEGTHAYLEVAMPEAQREQP